MIHTKNNQGAILTQSSHSAFNRSCEAILGCPFAFVRCLTFIYKTIREDLFSHFLLIKESLKAHATQKYNACLVYAFASTHIPES